MLKLCTGPSQGEGLLEPAPPPPPHFLENKYMELSTVEPRYNENILVITRFVNLYQGVSHIALHSTITGVKKNSSLDR